MGNSGERLQISVITVCRNAEATIEATLRSVAEQQKVDGLVEHFVVDGVSEDDTLGIVKGFSKVCWISEPDRGISDAFNKGLHLVKGSYIIYLNADDYLYDSLVLTDVINFIEENEKPDWVVGDVVEANGDKVAFQKRHYRPSCWSLIFRNRIGHPAVFLKRRVLLDVGGFDTRFRTSMDYELYERLCSQGIRPIYFPRIISVFSVHGLSSKKSPAMIRETQEVRGRFRNSRTKRLFGLVYDQLRRNP